MKYLSEGLTMTRLKRKTAMFNGKTLASGEKMGTIRGKTGSRRKTGIDTSFRVNKEFSEGREG